VRFLLSFAFLSSLVLTGCSVLLPVVGVATYPLDKQGAFEEAQQKYTSNLRYGLYDEARPFVEPELQARFESETHRFREMRFSDYRVESIEIDALRAKATAVVVFRGYWLSSPYEREMRAVQHWRRELPTQKWFVTPDFDSLLTPPAPAAAVSAPASAPR
jgi:hypothetical protein